MDEIALGLPHNASNLIGEASTENCRLRTKAGIWFQVCDCTTKPTSPGRLWESYVSQNQIVHRLAVS